MEKFEYKILEYEVFVDNTRVEKDLNDLGNEGWILVSFTTDSGFNTAHRFVLARPKQGSEE